MERESFNFEKLNVYQKSLQFISAVYDVTAKLPKEERFILVDQFRRAANSITLNIAEGYGESKIGFKRYLNISKGSLRECVAIISLCRMRNYFNEQTEEDLRRQCAELSKMLSGLIKSLL